MMMMTSFFSHICLRQKEMMKKVPLDEISNALQKSSSIKYVLNFRQTFPTVSMGVKSLKFDMFSATFSLWIKKLFHEKF